MKIAAEFVTAKGQRNDPEATLQIIRPNPDAALRSGPVPEMLVAPTAEDELRIAVNRILAWLQSGLKPSEISVLYRARGGWVSDLVSLIAKKTAVHWPQGPNGNFTDRTGVCVRTIHSAKGLQWRAVLVMRSDMMPYMPPDVDVVEQERLERGLMYVAMTRAEEMLAFTRSTLNGFASRIQHLLDDGRSQ
jgi:superfamily I DNA/RNA helicase